MKGSGSSVYTLKNSGSVYSCTCPAWAHQSVAIERRTCKHLRAYRGDDAEKERLGTAELSGKAPRAPRPPGAPDVGDAPDEATEPPLLLAHPWTQDIDLTGWWISEKLDGVRAYWDGTQFLSRLGNRFFPPPWFVDAFPHHPLDGELWGGRKLFQRTVGIVKRQDRSPLWKDLLYVVFDAPAHEGEFEERIEHARQSVEGKSAYVRIHEHVVCAGIDHLRSELSRVEALGGEGLMARRPRSKYEAGRSSSLLKVKSFRDAEARVIGHAAGAGRHKGRLGALEVELADGKRFNVGTGFSDEERGSPPPIGSIITFRYQELSDGGVPRFPSYVGVRIDAKEPSRLSVERSAIGRRPAAVAPAPAPPVAKAPPAAPPEARPRYFELVDSTSKKFWEIALEGTSFTTRYGKIGTDGQRSLKEYDSEATAQSEYAELVAEKTKKGYVES